MQDTRTELEILKLQIHNMSVGEFEKWHTLNTKLIVNDDYRDGYENGYATGYEEGLRD